MIAIPTLDFGSINVDAFRQRLRELISVFNEIDLPLQHRVVDYLITGHDTELLLDLREAYRQPNRPQFFKVNEQGWKPLNFKLSCKLLKLFNPPVAPVGYYQRLGQVCSQYPDLDRSPTKFDKRLPKWFNDLCRFALALVVGAPDEVSAEERRCCIEPALLSLTQTETDQLLRTILEAPFGDQTQLGYMLWYLLSLKKVIEQNMDRLMRIVLPEPALREQLIRVLDRTQADPGNNLGGVIDCGLALARKCKGEFQAILTAHRAAAKPILLERLTNGTPQQRLRAAEWLNRLYGKLIASALGEALSNEQDSKVRAVIEPIYNAYKEAETYSQALAQLLALPPVEMPAGELPLPPKFAVRLQLFLQGAMQHHVAQNNGGLPEQTASDAGYASPTQPSSDDLLALYLYMEGKSTTKPPKNEWLFRVLQEAPAIEQWCDPQKLHWLHIMRLLDAIGSLQERSSALTVFHHRLLNAHRRTQAAPYGLRELDAAAELLIGRPHLMSRGYLMEASRYELADADIWPAFVDQLKLLEDSIAGVPLDQYDRDVLGRRQTALAIAGMMPVLPQQLEEAAWKLALGDAGTLRPLARPLLKRTAHCVQRAMVALTHRSCGARMGAAELLQELGSVEAIAPLKQALKKEKFRPVQGHLLAALESLGANVDEFVGREKLLQDAKLGVRRPPRSMMWFPMDKLPVVRWAADNQPLDPIILRWWLIQCVEFKSTTCSPIMRRALDLCRRDDTLRLAHFILDEWISFDTDEPDRVELEKHYRAEAEQMAKALSSLGKKLSPESYVSRMVNAKLRDAQRAQSTHTERGMLSIVAAFGDDKCVEKIEKYIRTYTGNRALQAKSMLEVIPQIDAPNSLRILCSLAAGFRNAAISKRAGELLQEMSQRLGWSEDEMAERILPDAGFALSPDVGVATASPPEMVLSYGRREFRITVDNDLNAIVMNADGMRVKDLPAATQDDDRTLVRIAKDQLKRARQILKTTREQLTSRLHQAMCSRRTWNVRDWRELLAGHVLARVLCGRLVWAYQANVGSARVFFQLLGDGSVVDASGQPLDLLADGLISVAHPEEMELCVEQLWEKRLASQEINPLFAQTGVAVRQASRQRE